MPEPETQKSNYGLESNGLFQKKKWGWGGGGRLRAYYFETPLEFLGFFTLIPGNSRKSNA